MFSVLILTLNEERNLPECLASAEGLDIVVLDSGSSDRTVEIAREAGARVFSRAFDTFARQRNYAQRNIPFAPGWVFHLDADERLTPELVNECRQAAARNEVDGFFVAPKMLWHGQWLRRCTDFPAYQARFVRAPQFEFIDVGHGQREAPHMKMGRLQCNYLHEMAASGEASWLEKHQRYAREEAQRALSAALPPLRNLAAQDALVRRRALKSYAAHLPAKPMWRFIYQYILRGGFLDGGAAFRYCRLLARYDRFVVDEMRALRRAQPNRT
jgi:glycosyltransferase involved in cell wall biosynthesis